MQSCENGSLILLGQVECEKLPNVINGDFVIADTNFFESIIQLSNVKKVYGICELSHCRITSFSGIGRKCFTEIDQSLSISDDLFLNSLLGILTITKLKYLILSGQGQHSKNIQNIFNKHLQKDRDILECREELISAGYKNCAKL